MLLVETASRRASKCSVGNSVSEHVLLHTHTHAFNSQVLDEPRCQSGVLLVFSLSIGKANTNSYWVYFDACIDVESAITSSICIQYVMSPKYQTFSDFHHCRISNSISNSSLSAIAVANVDYFLYNICRQNDGLMQTFASHHFCWLWTHF